MPHSLQGHSADADDASANTTTLTSYFTKEVRVSILATAFDYIVQQVAGGAIAYSD